MRKTVIFGPDDTLTFLDIFINNDAELELEENFTLSIQLSRVTVRIGVGLGDPSEAVVVINDDDKGTCNTLRGRIKGKIYATIVM